MIHLDPTWYRVLAGAFLVIALALGLLLVVARMIRDDDDWSGPP